MPWTSGVFESLEVRFHDVSSTRSSQQPSDRVAVTAIISAWACAAPLDGRMATSSYDPPAKATAADDPFARTAVFHRPSGAAHPEGGAGQSASEA